MFKIQYVHGDLCKHLGIDSSTDQIPIIRSVLESIISLNEPLREISNNVVCATSRASDQPAHTRSLVRAFASRLNIL